MNQLRGSFSTNAKTTRTKRRALIQWLPNHGIAATKNGKILLKKIHRNSTIAFAVLQLSTTTGKRLFNN